MNKFKSYIKRILKLVTKEEMKILPGHLAFNLVLMIVPIFSIIGVIGSNFLVDKTLGALENNVPDAVLNILENALNTSGSDYNLMLFIIFSLWLVSGGCRAIINTSDILYKIKNTSSIKSYVKSFFMVIILFVLTTFMLIVPVFGDTIFKFLNHYFNETGINIVTNIYHYIKYPVSIVAMFISIKLLYTIAPSIRIESKYTNNGAWFTTISWFIASRIYSYHLNNYSNYNAYYGSLANILILLVWVYLLAYLFTIGIALNADNYLVTKKKLEEIIKN